MLKPNYLKRLSVRPWERVRALAQLHRSWCHPVPPGDLPGQPRHHQTLDGVERALEVILIILIVLAVVDDPEVEPAELVVRVVHAEVQLERSQGELQLRDPAADEGGILPLGR